MRNLLLAVGLVGLLGFVSACGDDGHADNIDGGSGGHAGKPAGIKAGSSNGDSGAGGETSDPLAPIVAITAPTPVEDPNDEGVLVGAEVTVTCLAKQSEAQGAVALDAASVKLSILDADGAVIETKAGMLGENQDEFASNFSLAAVPGGHIGFECTASDKSKRTATDRVDTLFDAGPTITFITPEPDEYLPLSVPLAIDFEVAAAPLADGDEGAEVDSVTFAMGGVEIDLGEAEESPGKYRLDVDLLDPALFDPAPNGPLPLTVTATNKRQPTAVTATTTQTASIDGAGPVIEIVNPVNKAVVGGNVRLTFKATDPISGVDPNTVVVSLNMVDIPYDPKSKSWDLTPNGTYTYEFDSRQVKNSKVQITVNVGASDMVGNASVVASELLYLDNYPPYVDLDPLNVRAITDKVTGDECSISFDPVGDAAKNDFDQVERAGFFRALVWENTNSDDEIPVLHYSGTNQSSVRIYLDADPSTPLLLDTDGDNYCDEVAEPNSDDALALGPILKAGNPWYKKGEETVVPATTGFGCVSKDAPKPEQLCTAKNSDMWQVIEHGNKEPAIYAAAVSAGLECTGVAWEFGSKVSEDGWVCFAARAVDKIGNVGVSRPLRICVDDTDRVGAPPCATSSIDAPSCTDGCIEPPRWGNVGILMQ